MLNFQYHNIELFENALGGGGGDVRHVDVLDRTVAANIENMPPEMLIMITINV